MHGLFAYRLWRDGSNILFSVKSPLTVIRETVNLIFFFPPTTFDEGLGTSSPAEMPYPTQASVSEARQLKRRLMESSRSLAAAAAHTTEVWAQGFWHWDLFFAESLCYQRYIGDAAETASVLTWPSLTYLSLPLHGSSVGSDILNWGGNSNSVCYPFWGGVCLPLCVM